MEYGRVYTQPHQLLADSLAEATDKELPNTRVDAHRSRLDDSWVQQAEMIETELGRSKCSQAMATNLLKKD